MPSMHTENLQKPIKTLSHLFRFRLILSISALSATLLLNGCVPALIGGGAIAGVSVVSDRRNFGILAEDKTIEMRARTKYKTAAEFRSSRIASVSYNRNLLLVGQVPDEQTSHDAADYGSKISGVERVINQLSVGPIISYQQQLDDTGITSKTKAAIGNANVTGFDITRVKVVTEDKVVYLLGQVTREEAEKIVNATQNVSGVRQIVKVFDFIN